MFVFNKNNFYEKYLRNIKTLPLYYINLDRSKERLDNITNTINSTNKLLINKNIQLKPTRISAIDGEDINNLKPFFINDKLPINVTPYEIACSCSHLLAIKKAYDNGDDLAIICEDDIVLTSFYENYDFFIENLKYLNENFDIIQGYVFNDLRYNISYKYIFNLIPWRSNYYGTQLYIITRDGMKHIIDTFFESNKIKNHINNKRFVADYIIYNSCKTVSSNIPLCQATDDNISTIHQDKDQSHFNLNKIVIQKNEYLTNLKQNIKNFSTPYNKDILTGDYIIFTSLGDNSKDAYVEWVDYIKKSELNIDLVIYYYGNNDNYFDNVKKNCSLAVKSKGIKFDNFYKFFWTYNENLNKSNYKSMAIFDDDLIIESVNKKENPLDILFKIGDDTQSYIWGPSCNPNKHKYHTLSWWENTYTIPNSKFHYTNLIETNSMIFNFNCLKYCMLHYKMNEVPSYGSDILFHQLLGKNLQNKYLICDTVFYINPSVLYKDINTREIDTVYGLDTRREKWEKFADEHYLDKQLHKRLIYSVSRTRNAPGYQGHIKPRLPPRVQVTKQYPNIKYFNAKKGISSTFKNLLYN